MVRGMQLAKVVEFAVRLLIFSDFWKSRYCLSISCDSGMQVCLYPFLNGGRLIKI
jgi:hypothetical protein